MIRDRLKKAARKIAIKAFNMEFDTEDRDPLARGNPDASKFDPSVIPKIVDGDGDTPGPNHKTDIGRTWTAAQLVGGVGACFIDIRPPLEVVAGMLPGAMVLPLDTVKDHLELLPKDKETRITVYDQLGGSKASEVAAWLDAQGWVYARRLQGGYAEWIEHDEPIAIPSPAKGDKLKVGDPVLLADGRSGWVLHAKGKATYTVYFEDGTVGGPFKENELGA